MLLFAVAYRYYYKIPNVAGECYYNQNQSIYENVELRQCAMVTNIKWSAAIAGASTASIFIMSTAAVALEKWRERKVLSGEAATTENTISEAREERAADTVEPLVEV
ncbi:hypothetical protein IFR05_004444 [Cadophora sp. M221]|nr:hypothetical protein IFR05_004444 [Cadophora sp. M221]